MSRPPLLSVIVPVYNAERYLAQCVDSILGQTFTDLELLLVDDGSPDNCGSICDAYARKDARVKVFHIPNGGVSNARNTGLAHASGTWIAFVDADDWLDPQCYEQALAAVQRHDLDFVQFGYSETTDDGQVLRRHAAETPPLPLAEFIKRDKFSESASMSLFKTHIIREQHLQFPSGIKLGEDQIFCYSYLLHCRRCKSAGRCFYFYRTSPTSVTHNMKPEDLVASVRAFQNFPAHTPLQNRIGLSLFKYVCCLCYNPYRDFSVRELREIVGDQKFGFAYFLRHGWITSRIFILLDSISRRWALATIRRLLRLHHHYTPAAAGAGSSRPPGK